MPRWRNWIAYQTSNLGVASSSLARGEYSLRLIKGSGTSPDRRLRAPIEHARTQAHTNRHTRCTRPGATAMNLSVNMHNKRRSLAVYVDDITRVNFVACNFVHAITIPKADRQFY